MVTASASLAVRAGSATATDLTPSSRTVPVFAATDRSAVPAARRRFSTSKASPPSAAAAEPDREDQRGGQLAAAGDLGELFEFAGRAKGGERVGEGTAERFVYAVRAGCDARAVRGLRNPDDKDVSLGCACC